MGRAARTRAIAALLVVELAGLNAAGHHSCVQGESPGGRAAHACCPPSGSDAAPRHDARPSAPCLGFCHSVATTTPPATIAPAGVIAVPAAEEPAALVSVPAPGVDHVPLV